MTTFNLKIEYNDGLWDLVEQNKEADHIISGIAGSTWAIVWVDDPDHIIITTTLSREGDTTVLVVLNMGEALNTLEFDVPGELTDDKGNNPHVNPEICTRINAWLNEAFE